MKRILAAFVPLTFAALFLPATPAQDVDVRVKVRQPRATVTLPPPSYRPPAAYAPPVAGTGCRGYSAGCVGYQPRAKTLAEVGYETELRFKAAPQVTRALYGAGCVGTYGASCYGRAAGGCVGTYGSGCYGRPAYGAPRADGYYNTRTGNPPPPALFPGRGPIRDFLRLANGYDVGPW